MLVTTGAGKHRRYLEFLQTLSSLTHTILQVALLCQLIDYNILDKDKSVGTTTELVHLIRASLLLRKCSLLY